MRTAIRSVSIAAAACLVFSAGAVVAQDEMAFEAKDPLKVGYSVYDMQQPYWQEYALLPSPFFHAYYSHFYLYHLSFLVNIFFNCIFIN